MTGWHIPDPRVHSKAGMGHTDLNTVKYALNTQYAYNTIPYFMQFGSADYWPKMDPIRPKRSQFFSNILCVINILYKIALEAHWKAVVGAEIA